jgi:hypothetical protein
VTWQAHWIWSQNLAAARLETRTATPSEYLYVRRAFRLDAEPSTALLHISADTFYRLTVNGTLVGHGPARSDPAWMSYDTHGVADLLGPGDNVIAIEVNSFIRSPGALICQCHVLAGEQELVIATDEAWRVLPAESWDPRTLPNTPWDPSEIYDARRAPVGWQEPAFDDSGWQTPALRDHQDTRNQRVAVAPALPGHTHTEPYLMLEPRDIPLMVEDVVLPVSILDQGEAEEIRSSDQVVDIALEMAIEPLSPLQRCRIEGADGLLTADGGPVIVENEFPYRSPEGFYTFWERHEGMPVTRSAYLVLDFGRLVNARFELDVEGAEGSIVDIGYSGGMAGDRVLLRPYRDQCHADRYVLREGRQTWRSFHWKQFRYVHLVFRNLNLPLRLHAFRAIRTEHPLKQRGAFECSDPFVTHLWHATTNTVRLTLHDSYMDTAEREKRIWTGDASQQLLGAFAAFGDIPATHRYLRMMVRNQSPVGWFPDFLLQALTDGAGQRLPYLEHSLQFVMRIGEYYWYSGNQALVDELYPAVYKFLTWLSAYREDGGLLGFVPTKRWIDWAACDLRGQALATNLLYFGCLRYAVALARTYGRDQDAEQLAALARPISAAVNDRFWDEHRGLFTDNLIDGQRTGSFSEHANYLALLVDVPDGARRTRVLDNLLAFAPDVAQAEPIFMLYPLQALLHAGQAEAALDLMRTRYGRMLRSGADTLREEWSNRVSLRYGTWWARYRGAAHGAAAFVSYLLSTEILGVKPVEPGFRVFSVHPQWGDLTCARGTVPAPVGDIAVSWEKGTDRYALRVHAPEDTSARIWMPLAAEHLVDGVPVDRSRSVESLERLDDGVVLTVGAGEHDFSAERP